MIQDILKNFKNKLSNKDIDLSLIYFEITDDIKDEHLNKLVSLAQDEPQKYQINSNNKFIYKYHELNSEVRRQNINELLDEIF